MEAELSGFVIDKRDLSIVMSGYLWQHLFQWNVVIDDGLWCCDSVGSQRISGSNICGLWSIDDLLSLWCMLPAIFIQPKLCCWGWIF